jgi:peptidoglycan hydrolase CwlO-like protein
MKCPFSTQRGFTMKKLLVIGLIVVAGLWVIRKTHLASYAGTIWSQVRQEAKAQVPVKFELDRIRHEIAQMDDDIRGMVSPIAEHMATISELRRDIERTRGRLVQQKASLLTLTTSLEKGGDLVLYQGSKVPAQRLRDKMQRDFANYKLTETGLATKEKLLAAREKALDATREQLNKLIAKKRDFEVQVANLEAEQQLIEAAGAGTDLRVDDSRATEIQSALEGVRHQQEVVRAKLRLLTGEVVTNTLPAPDQPGVSTEEVRTYLQGGAPAEEARTAQK